MGFLILAIFSIGVVAGVLFGFPLYWLLRRFLGPVWRRRAQS
jgi:hypothetical protein